MNVGPVTRITSKTPVPYELRAVHRDTHDTKTICFALPDDATFRDEQATGHVFRRVSAQPERRFSLLKYNHCMV